MRTLYIFKSLEQFLKIYVFLILTLLDLGIHGDYLILGLIGTALLEGRRAVSEVYKEECAVFHKSEWSHSRLQGYRFIYGYCSVDHC